MRSYFVFVRVVNDREVFAIGEGVLPQGVRQIGCFASLEEACAQRDKKRREGLRVTLPLMTRPRTCKRSETTSYALA
jgi:hypothetical protein